MTELHRVRTLEERRGMLLGYAFAINDITDYGMRFARDHLREMLEIEGLLDEVNNTVVPEPGAVPALPQSIFVDERGRECE